MFYKKKIPKPENPEVTRVMIGSLYMGYDISDTIESNLQPVCHKCMPILSDYSAVYLIIEGKFHIKGKNLPSAFLA